MSWTGSSLKTYWTVAFDREFMLSLIFLGRAELNPETGVVKKIPGGDLCLAVWLLMVPEVYRPQVTELAGRIAKKYLGQKATDDLRRVIVANIWHAIRDEIEPIRP